MVVGGDFNEILSNSEKEGGAWRNWSVMNDFARALEDYDLHGTWSQGPWFTLERSCDDRVILREKLDRFECK